MTYADFQNIYDFTLIEKAVQSQFVSIGNFVAPLNDDDPKREEWTPAAGKTPFYTAFQSLTFQKCRPRVFVSAFQFSAVPGAYALDANNNFREKSWEGTMRVGIVSLPNYSAHTTLRATVLAIVPQIMPQIVADNSLFATTGINAVLQYHQVSQFYVPDLTTTVSPEEGAYQSILPIKIAFSVKPAAWPAGMITT